MVDWRLDVSLEASSTWVDGYSEATVLFTKLYSNVSKPLQLLFCGIQGLTQNFHFRPFLWAVLTMHAKVKLCGKHWPQNILKGRNIHEPAITIQWVSYKSVNGCLNYCTWTSQQVMHGQWNSNTALKNKKDKQKNLRSSTHRIYIG